MSKLTIRDWVPEMPHPEDTCCDGCGRVRDVYMHPKAPWRVFGGHDIHVAGAPVCFVCFGYGVELLDEPVEARVVVEKDAWGVERVVGGFGDVGKERK